MNQTASATSTAAVPSPTATRSMPWPARTPGEPALGAALLLGAATLRLAYGGHFLSDALLGGLITLIVIVLVNRAVWPRGRP